MLISLKVRGSFVSLDILVDWLAKDNLYLLTNHLATFSIFAQNDSAGQRLRVRVMFQSLGAASAPFIDSFCQPNFNGSWSSLTNELGAFTPCFIDIIVLGSATVCLALLAAFRLHILVKTPCYLRLNNHARYIQTFMCFLSTFCGIVPLMQLSARVSVDSITGDDPLPPFEVFLP